MLVTRFFLFRCNRSNLYALLLSNYISFRHYHTTYCVYPLFYAVRLVSFEISYRWLHLLKKSLRIVTPFLHFSQSFCYLSIVQTVDKVKKRPTYVILLKYPSLIRHIVKYIKLWLCFHLWLWISIRVIKIIPDIERV